MRLPASFLLISCLTVFAAPQAGAENISAYINQAFKIKVLDGDGSDYTQMTLKIKQKAPSMTPEEVILDMGGGESVSVTLQNAERGPVPLKVNKINFVTVQASAPNTAGERTLRLKFNSRYATSSVKTDYDLQLKLVGPRKLPMVLLNGRAMTNLELRLNKKVSGRSMIQMLFSPPKVAKTKLSTIGCSTEEVVKFVQRYHSTDYPRRLGCSLKRFSEADLSLLDFTPDVYGSFYINGQDPGEEIKASVNTAKELRSLGLVFSKFKESKKNRLLAKAIEGGDRPLFDYLMAQGLRPQKNELEAALKNYYQYDFSKKKLVVSPTGKYLYERAKALAPKDSLKNFVYTIFTWQDLLLDNSSMDALFQSDPSSERNQAFIEYYVATIQLAIESGWDPFLKVPLTSDSDMISGYEYIKDNGNLFTPEEKRQILALLDRYAQKQAAAKSNNRAIATVNQSLKNLGAGCGCQRN